MEIFKMQCLMRRHLPGLVFVFTTTTAALGFVTPVFAESSQPTQVEVLLSKQAITELLYKYPRGLDRLDRDLLLSLAHPDASMKFGKNSFPTWSAYVDWLIKAHTPMLGNNHRITNILIEVNGDTAVSESTGTATLLVKQEGREDQYEERWMHSRYLDKWSRRNGKWALDARQTVIDYRRISYVSAEEVKNRYEIGARTGRADPSYTLFGTK
jgi:hypothetical protein